MVGAIGVGAGALGTLGLEALSALAPLGSFEFAIALKAYLSEPQTCQDGRETLPKKEANYLPRSTRSKSFVCNARSSRL